MKIGDKVFVKTNGEVGEITQFIDDSHVATISCGYTDTYPIKDVVLYDKADPFFKDLQEKVDQVGVELEQAFAAFRELKEQGAFFLPKEMLDTSVLCDELEENGWSSSSLYC